MLAKVASHYGRGPVVAIDPHNSPILLDHSGAAKASSYQEFLHALKSNSVEQFVSRWLIIQQKWLNRGIAQFVFYGSMVITVLRVQVMTSIPSCRTSYRTVSSHSTMH